MGILQGRLLRAGYRCAAGTDPQDLWPTIAPMQDTPATGQPLQNGANRTGVSFSARLP
jgi:hypothetical protein